MISFTDFLICGKNHAILAKSTLKFLAPAQSRTVQAKIFSSKTSYCFTFRNCRKCVIFCSSQKRIIRLCFCSLVGLTIIKQPMSHCENFATGISKLLSASSCLGVLSIDSCPSSFESICSSLLFFLCFGKKLNIEFCQAMLIATDIAFVNNTLLTESENYYTGNC